MTMSNQIALPALALALSCLMFAQPYSVLANPKPRAKEEAPNFSFAGPDGNAHSLKDLRGTVVVLDFWASWCPPCRRSLPELEALNEKYKDENVVFIGVNDEERATIDKFSKANELHFYTIQDDDEKISNAFDVEAIPNTYVIGKDGWVAASFQGFDDNDDELDKAIQKALLAN
jgi:peroxiredoxin